MILAEDIFLSLQWEWPTTWKPSIFVRFFWCNLCCKWCDSLYAVNNPESIVDISAKEVVEQIRKLKCKHVVFTWWEPTLFEDTIAEIQFMLWDGYTYEIETNWSNPIKNTYQNINISPKLSNSWNKWYPFRALENIAFWRTEWSGVCFKFVAKSKKDFDEIKQFITENTIPESFVYIMPEWTTNESQINKSVLQFCIDNEYRYCQRMHIILFGNRKWV